MRQGAVLLIILALSSPLWAQDSPQPQFIPGNSGCISAVQTLKLPVKPKMRKNPRRMRWEQIDKTVTELRRNLHGATCKLTFDLVFQHDRKDEVFFPLTNRVLTSVPEGELRGIQVFDSTGQPLGVFENRVTFERTGDLYAARSYKLYYFQFKNAQGELQSSGNRLLLDSYLIKWSDVRGKSLVDTSVPE